MVKRRCERIRFTTTQPRFGERYIIKYVLKAIRGDTQREFLSVAHRQRTPSFLVEDIPHGKIRELKTCFKHQVRSGITSRETNLVGGSFLDRELAESDWDLTLREDACGALLTVEGEYEAVGRGGFHYVIYLRPWGSRWPGGKEEQPYYYETWYLPLIEAGEPMPETIGKGQGRN